MKDHVTQYDMLHYTSGNNLLITVNSKIREIKCVRKTKHTRCKLYISTFN